MNRLFYFLVLFFISFISIGQDKLLTMEDAVIGQWRDLYPKNMRNVQWQGNADFFTFQDYNNLYQSSIKSSDSTLILSLVELNTILKNNHVDTVSYIPYVSWKSSNELHFYAGKFWHCIDINSKQLISSIELPLDAGDTKLCIEKDIIAFTNKNNLSLADNKGVITAVTSDNDLNIVNGQSVSRNEFGINGGIFWSPKGSFLAYYRKDESKVGDYPLVDITAREARLKNIKYPMAGMASEHISLGVYNLETGKTIFIEGSDTVTEKYLTNISWDPNEEYIYIQVLNRAQNHMKLNKYSVTDGSLVQTLFEEKHDKYVEPFHPLIFLTNKKDRFVYQSRNLGYNHAFLYKTNGELVKQITKGEWEITDIVKVEGNDMFYLSTEKNPTEIHFYKINFQSGKKERLTKEDGIHEIVMSANAKYYIDSYSNVNSPRNILACDVNGTNSRLVLSAPNPLADFIMPEMEIGTIKADDGVTDLYYRLIKPINMDSTLKYPAVVYVYGGPHAQLVENSWLGGARLWEYYMAQNGYVMLTVDNRGSMNRGLEFENVIHRQCGVVEMRDQMKGIELLKETNYVDMDRVGVHGWSYGGFMTTSLMVNHPDVFKVGVAGGPVIDWKYYEIMYGERYMDTPDENPEGYMFTSLVPRARDLKGKLLIIHGGIDPTVVMQHSQAFIQECIKNRVPVDYFIYPVAEHNVRGYDRVHLMQKVTSYFEDYLK